MKVLMFGWEFPPFKSGGLGTACYDLTKGLARQGVDVTFVMPSAPEGADSDFVRIIGCNNLKDRIKIKKIHSMLQPYMTSEAYHKSLKNAPNFKSKGGVYGSNLYNEVCRYSESARFIAEEEDFDVIHAHDWMTYQAGINAKQASGKPLVLHMHATEFDRTGGNPNSYISHIEYTGLKSADRIIANSSYTKQNIINHYNIEPERIEIVHWGIDPDNLYLNMDYDPAIKKSRDKIVLFLGRITLQKGPDYFIEAAKKVLDFEKNVKFVVAGEGDMLDRMIDRTVELGISDKFLFTGWLKGADVYKAFKMADLYIMPSVSEPFGLVALEAIRNSTPIIISKNSGVSEVVSHALKVDFWDINQMANHIVSIIKYKELEEEMKENCYKESCRFNLDKPARECIHVYDRVVSD